jgi:chromosome partitioning protein
MVYSHHATTMTTYAVANQKGGVGKTTTAVNLAIGLARRGYETLLVDLDPQANATYALLGAETPTATVYDLLIERQPLAAVRVPAQQPHLEVLPADIDLAGAEIDLLGAIGGQARLRALLGRTALPYRYVVIDTPPSLGLLTINALAAADAIIIPVSASLFAMKGLAQLQETVGKVRESLNRPDLRVRGILATLVDRTNVAKDVLGTLQAHFPGQVFGTVIPKNVTLEEAHGRPGSVYEYAPNSAGAAAYDRFVEEVIADG